MSKEKTQLFTMRIPLSKYQKLKEASKYFDMPISKMFMRAVEQKDFNIPKHRKRKEPPKADPQLLRQLAGIGNNLNQIAKRLNKGEKLEVLPHLLSIEREFDEIIALHNKCMESFGNAD